MEKSNKDIHKEHRKRMRKKFLKNGFDGFAEHEILEMLLYYSISRKDTNELAHIILKKYKTLANVFDATPEELIKIDGVSEVTASLLTMIPKIARIYEISKWDNKPCLNNIEKLGEYAASMFKDKQNEEFGIISLDANRNLKWSGIVIEGTVDRTEAYPRKVAEEMIKRKATKVVLVHNHPNGTLTASVSDREATKVLKDVLNSIGIEVLDHIIVSGTRYFSMKESGFKF